MLIPSIGQIIELQLIATFEQAGRTKVLRRGFLGYWVITHKRYARNYEIGLS